MILLQISSEQEFIDISNIDLDYLNGLIISSAENKSEWLFKLFVTFIDGENTILLFITSMWDALQCQGEVS